MIGNNQLITLNQFVNQFISNLRNEIDNKTSGTGTLSNSIKFNNLINIDSIEIQIDSENYATFIDKGVNGTETSYGSPYSFTEDTLPSIQGLTPLANRIGASPWALAKSIQKKGIEPKQITINIEKNLNNFANLYTDALWKDFKNKNN